jgi:hypothetical protein
VRDTYCSVWSGPADSRARSRPQHSKDHRWSGRKRASAEPLRREGRCGCRVPDGDAAPSQVSGPAATLIAGSDQCDALSGCEACDPGKGMPTTACLSAPRLVPRPFFGFRRLRFWTKPTPEQFERDLALRCNTFRPFFVCKCRLQQRNQKDR